MLLYANVSVAHSAMDLWWMKMDSPVKEIFEIMPLFIISVGVGTFAEIMNIGELPATCKLNFVSDYPSVCFIVGRVLLIPICQMVSDSVDEEFQVGRTR